MGASSVGRDSSISAFRSMLKTIYEEISAPALPHNLHHHNNRHTVDFYDSPKDVEALQQQQALDFLYQQKRRAIQVERSLLLLTHNVLPNDNDDDSTSSVMMKRELFFAVYELQNIYVRQLTLLHEILDPPTLREQQQQQQQPEKGESMAAPAIGAQASVRPHWSVGSRLASVPEMDHDTTATDGSVVSTGNFVKTSLSLSPSFLHSQSYESNDASITNHILDAGRIEKKVETSMHVESFTQSTANEANESDEQGPNANSLKAGTTFSSPKAFSPRVNVRNQSNVYSPDEMNRTGVSSGQRRVDTLAELEAQLRTIKTVGHEGRQVSTNLLSFDEDQDETLEASESTLVAHQLLENQPLIQNSPVSAAEECSLEDDSARYCPTILQTYTPKPVPKGVPVPPPSEIEFDEPPAGSPSINTVLTMDEDLDETIPEKKTFLDETMEALEPVRETSRDEETDSSNISDETPVLDRYRLERDDSAPGGFVVRPNPRRQHRRTIPGRAMPQEHGQRKIQRSMVQAPLHRHTKPIMDENAFPNFATKVPRSEKKSQPQSLDGQNRRLLLTSPLQRIDQPVNRKSSDVVPVATNARVSEGRWAGDDSAPRQQSFPSLKISSSKSASTTARNGNAPAAQSEATRLPAGRLPGSSSRRSAAIFSSSTPTSAGQRRTLQEPDTGRRLHQSLPGNSRRSCLVIQPISLEEYEASPSCVTMHATLIELYEAVLLLNQALREKAVDSDNAAVIKSSQIEEIWDAIPLGRHKKLLLCLQYWKRMALRGSETKWDGTEEHVYSMLSPKASI